MANLSFSQQIKEIFNPRLKKEREQEEQKRRDEKYERTMKEIKDKERRENNLKTAQAKKEAFKKALTNPYTGKTAWGNMFQALYRGLDISYKKYNSSGSKTVTTTYRTSVAQFSDLLERKCKKDPELAEELLRGMILDTSFRREDDPRAQAIFKKLVDLGVDPAAKYDPIMMGDETMFDAAVRRGNPIYATILMTSPKFSPEDHTRVNKLIEALKKDKQPKQNQAVAAMRAGNSR